MESENLSGLSGSVGQVRYAALFFIKLQKLWVFLYSGRPCYKRGHGSRSHGLITHGRYGFILRRRKVYADENLAVSRTDLDQLMK